MLTQKVSFHCPRICLRLRWNLCQENTSRKLDLAYMKVYPRSPLICNFHFLSSYAITSPFSDHKIPFIVILQQDLQNIFFLLIYICLFDCPKESLNFSEILLGISTRNRPQIVANSPGKTCFDLCYRTGLRIALNAVTNPASRQTLSSH